jgi:hypothetical protein
MRAGQHGNGVELHGAEAMQHGVRGIAIGRGAVEALGAEDEAAGLDGAEPVDGPGVEVRDRGQATAPFSRRAAISAAE